MLNHAVYHVVFIMYAIIMSKKKRNSSRLLGDLVFDAMEPTLKKRGFATRDILKYWPQIAPEPYNRVSIPSRLNWAKNDNIEGATLYLRCERAYQTTLSYESENICAAINRYFGYFLVGKIKLSPEPFIAGSDKKNKIQIELSKQEQKKIDNLTSKIKNEELKKALQKLGRELTRKRKT